MLTYRKTKITHNTQHKLAVNMLQKVLVTPQILTITLHAPLFLKSSEEPLTSSQIQGLLNQLLLNHSTNCSNLASNFSLLLYFYFSLLKCRLYLRRPYLSIYFSSLVNSWLQIRSLSFVSSPDLSPIYTFNCLFVMYVP